MNLQICDQQGRNNREAFCGSSYYLYVLCICLIFSSNTLTFKTGPFYDRTNKTLVKLNLKRSPLGWFSRFFGHSSHYSHFLLRLRIQFNFTFLSFSLHYIFLFKPLIVSFVVHSISLSLSLTHETLFYLPLSLFLSSSYASILLSKTIFNHPLLLLILTRSFFLSFFLVCSYFFFNLICISFFFFGMAVLPFFASK